jgi:multimeric flavodoxin WrbA
VSATSIKVLGISGSPRRKATDFAVNEALAYARDEFGAAVDYFTLHAKSIKPCRHCDYCVRTKNGCVLKDDVVEVYPKMRWADAWILGSPVYQGQISGQLKTLLDRCRALVAQDPKVLRNKVGMGIAIGGDRSGGQEPALQAMIDFYIINEMIPVGGGSFGANLGAALWSKDEGKAGVMADEGGLAGMRRTVARLVDVTRLLHP